MFFKKNEANLIMQQTGMLCRDQMQAKIKTCLLATEVHGNLLFSKATM